MISVDEALERILARVKQLGIETVPLADAVGRRLAAPLVARHTQPPFDASAMDGYAMRAADVVPGQTLRIIGVSQAGEGFAGKVSAGECVRIFTGAPLPSGADAVVMQENATASGSEVSFSVTARVGQSVRKRGNDFVAGQPLLTDGKPLTANRLNLVASANYAEVSVTRRPRVAILATGDELVLPGGTLGPDQIVSSNTIALAALLSPYAESVTDLGIVPDDRQQIERVLRDGFAQGFDVLLTSGGASVGDRDFVQEVLRDIGVNLDFWKIRMRPGKPLMFGTIERTLVFGLPGNPTSAFATATVLVLPALRSMAGAIAPEGRRWRLPLASPISGNSDRRHFLRGTFENDVSRGMVVRAVSEPDSNHSSSLAAADGLIVQQEFGPDLEVGDLVEVIPFSALD